ncbi:TetR/AcrR family transcriptional regulator [Actinomadura atramentaria]|uniref:TetR/AcrR family transcriptional regulator n=1 Tax=Actinomadura atramentaria TaxID=1990 RepID=UPI000375DD4D|nr:TetR/AcrR family transcriptional regulator [Actinomadura atramentaria]
MSDEQNASGGDGQRERVVEVATLLFAELGYDATPLELVADTAGTGTGKIIELFGGKQALYLEVMRRAYEAEQLMLAGSLEGFTPDESGATAVVDTVLDFYAAHPHLRALWMHRWMADAADTEALESEYVLSQTQHVLDRVGSVIPDDVDTYFLVATIIWTVFGFLSGGRPTPGFPTRHRPDAEEIEHFRGYLHVLVRRMLAPR